MKISGRDAISILANLESIVRLQKKDNTDKFWSYKMLSGSHAKFAFDPKTKTKLVVRFDQNPPRIHGVGKVEDIRGKNMSTALNRVFSGRGHVAKYRAEIESEECLLAVLNALK
ncbi:hypothetical protein [Photobacterium rosenbergii]|uniref:hypothetical protein n=1 Tax=Photobacterium rosenbergii TaxID=294936 RepID=UPI001C98FFCC|nr:hypothetical protein [Photobacterium rosenbergii]MBY5944663.1 hypothetical protein [Photobacterium rosenbergii]